MGRIHGIPHHLYCMKSVMRHQGLNHTQKYLFKIGCSSQYEKIRKKAIENTNFIAVKPWRAKFIEDSKEAYVQERSLIKELVNFRVEKLSSKNEEVIIACQESIEIINHYIPETGTINFKDIHVVEKPLQWFINLRHENQLGKIKEQREAGRWDDVIPHIVGNMLIRAKYIAGVVIYERKDGIYEIIDGQQRFESFIMPFMNNELYLNLAKLPECVQGMAWSTKEEHILCCYKDLPIEAKRKLSEVRISVALVKENQGMTKKDAMMTYYCINHQVPLNANEKLYSSANSLFLDHMLREANNTYLHDLKLVSKKAQTTMSVITIMTSLFLEYKMNQLFANKDCIEYIKSVKGKAVEPDDLFIIDELADTIKKVIPPEDINQYKHLCQHGEILRILIYIISQCFKKSEDVPVTKLKKALYNINKDLSNLKKKYTRVPATLTRFRTVLGRVPGGLGRKIEYKQEVCDMLLRTYIYKEVPKLKQIIGGI